VTLVRRAFTLAVVLSSSFVSVSNAALPLASVGPTCVGDCDNSGSVTVDEIVNGANIALDVASDFIPPRFSESGFPQGSPGFGEGGALAVRVGGAKHRQPNRTTWE
jgi:hypothetical protein